ncbi:uncharacterized protein GLRG_07505 [Colletotrichum graminicola M1.001]|uniref:Rhodopsin domain-containing protein n=1 Tax=Colletotrichum graminicola (strain M1.001 / M2 / FGSC 10212) TaxID=645133 RepID=E3QNC3_COLGM|nr:uncharacterized protein GLRG_07505 [Colletotrichum graminicola M1.001]EFQ32361.1 hypothetical protein GLRG_07505 [Colletotrichum graminicola M1.001]
MADGSGLVGALPPPPGIVPDFYHPTDLSRTRLFAAIVVMAVAITIPFIFRIYSKTRITVEYYKEDWTCTVAYVMLMCYLGTVLVMAYYGEGYHAWEVTKKDYSKINLFLYIGSIIYCPAAYFTKVTLLLFEARVFSVYQRVAKTIHVFIVALAILYMPILFTKAFLCTPVAAAWNLDIKPAKCLNQRKVFLSDMSLGLLTDICILVLPLLLTRPLHVSLRTKIKIVMLLGAGGAATGVSALRLYKEVECLGTTDATEGYFLLNLTTWFTVQRHSTPNVPRTCRHDNARKAWYSKMWSRKTATTLMDLDSQGESNSNESAIAPDPEAVLQSDMGSNCGHITGVSGGGGPYESLLEPPSGIKVPEEALTRNYTGVNGNRVRETERERTVP